MLIRKKRKLGEFYEEINGYVSYDSYDYYEYADIIFNNLTRRYIGLFNKLKNLTDDEKEVVRQVNEVYQEVDELTRKYLLILLKKIYKKVIERLDVEDVVDTVYELWLMKVLEGYDPVTKYVYIHEVDRKRARTIESIIASDNKPKEVETAKKQWSKQAKQYADNIVQVAVDHAFEEAGIQEVIWRTEEDLRVCPVCEERDGVIYPFDDYPSKPHYGCRCWVEPL